MVQIAHQVSLGENNLIVSQVGIAGSTKTGRNMVMGGQCGVNRHITLIDGVIHAARSAVSKSLKQVSIAEFQPWKIVSSKNIFSFNGTWKTLPMNSNTSRIKSPNTKNLALSCLDGYLAGFHKTLPFVGMGNSYTDGGFLRENLAANSLFTLLSHLEYHD